MVIIGELATHQIDVLPDLSRHRFYVAILLITTYGTRGEKALVIIVLPLFSARVIIITQKLLNVVQVLQDEVCPDFLVSPVDDLLAGEAGELAAALLHYVGLDEPVQPLDEARAFVHVLADQV